MKLQFALLTFLAVSVTAAETDLAPVASLGDPAPLRFADGKMSIEEEDGSWRVNAPNFWSCGWQVKDAVFAEMEADGEARLVVKAEGSSANEELVLKVRLMSADWARGDEYEIPLDALSHDGGQEFTATTPLGEPVSQEGGGLTEGESPRIIQFLMQGKGNAPVELHLQAIGAR